MKDILFIVLSDVSPPPLLDLDLILRFLFSALSFQLPRCIARTYPSFRNSLTISTLTGFLKSLLFESQDSINDPISGSLFKRDNGVPLHPTCVCQNTSFIKPRPPKLHHGRTTTTRRPFLVVRVFRCVPIWYPLSGPPVITGPFELGIC